MEPITPETLQQRISELETILTGVLNEALLAEVPTLTSRMVSFQEEFIIEVCRARGMNVQEYMFVRDQVLEQFNQAGWIASYVPGIRYFSEALLSFTIRS